MAKRRVPGSGRVQCRVCRCTHFEPCNPPCAWASKNADPFDSGDLCTNCADLVAYLVLWFHSAHKPTVAALIRELKKRMEVKDGR